MDGAQAITGANGYTGKYSANLLVSERPPLGKQRLGDWLTENEKRVGLHYSSEIARHYKAGETEHAR